MFGMEKVSNISGSNTTLCENFKTSLKIFPAGYGVLFVIGLVLNITAMYFILFRIKRWSPSTIYINNLTMSDTLYILTFPILVYYYSDNGSNWPLSISFCKFFRFIFYTNLYASILFLGCISLHRFAVVCHSVRSTHLVSTRHARIASVCIWAVVLVIQTPVLFFSTIKVIGKKHLCIETSEELSRYFHAYILTVSILFFVLPFIVVLVCYGRMVQKLLEPSRVGGSTSPHFKQKSVKMIIIVLLAFMLCFLPYHLVRHVYIATKSQQKTCSQPEAIRLAYKFTRLLASASSCINPILYFMAGQGFRSNLNRRVKQSQGTENSNGRKHETLETCDMKLQVKVKKSKSGFV